MKTNNYKGYTIEWMGGNPFFKRGGFWGLCKDGKDVWTENHPFHTLKDAKEEINKILKGEVKATLL